RRSSGLPAALHAGAERQRAGNRPDAVATRRRDRRAAQELSHRWPGVGLRRRLTSKNAPTCAGRAVSDTLRESDTWSVRRGKQALGQFFAGARYLVGSLRESTLSPVSGSGRCLTPEIADTRSE